MQFVRRVLSWRSIHFRLWIFEGLSENCRFWKWFPWFVQHNRLEKKSFIAPLILTALRSYSLLASHLRNKIFWLCKWSYVFPTLRNYQSARVHFQCLPYLKDCRTFIRGNLNFPCPKLEWKRIFLDISLQISFNCYKHFSATFRKKSYKSSRKMFFLWALKLAKTANYSNFRVFEVASLQ